MKPSLRKRGQLEGELCNTTPRVRPCAEFARQREYREDGNCEGAVFAVAPRDGKRKVLGMEAAGEEDQPGFGARFDRGIAARRGYGEGCPG